MGVDATRLTTGYFFRSPAVLRWIYTGLTWRLPGDERRLYLTFDDGPVPGPTEFVLGELNRVKAKATFFCIGDNVLKNPAVFSRILDEGHAVGNHTHNHLSGWKTSLEDYISNVKQCDEVIIAHSGGRVQTIAYFRPPYGRITRRQISAIDHHQIIMWDVLTNDYARNLPEEACLRGSITATRPGSIIVFHDSLKAERNLRHALPRFLDHFSSIGFSFHSL